MMPDVWNFEELNIGSQQKVLWLPASFGTRHFLLTSRPGPFLIDFWDLQCRDQPCAPWFFPWVYLLTRAKNSTGWPWDPATNFCQQGPLHPKMATITNIPSRWRHLAATGHHIWSSTKFPVSITPNWDCVGKELGTCWTGSTKIVSHSIGAPPIVCLLLTCWLCRR